ncbi:MAG: hypothetical protein EOM59_16200 [Clostridia bacterium]|nr:hypothetical protein [Clostridia bacterium]
MKVDDYVPKYGLFLNRSNLIWVNGKRIELDDLFDNYPDFELTDVHIDFLDTFDHFALQSVLNEPYFTQENVTFFLKELLDNFRESGGNPLEWLFETLVNVNDNPNNYRVELRQSIEHFLLEQVKYFESLSLYIDTDTIASHELRNGYEPNFYSTLSDAFIEIEKYQRIMNLLVSKNHCNAGNYRWKDRKEVLIGFLKDLHFKGFLHRKLSNNELISICDNTFGCKVSKSTCRIKPNCVTLPTIPLASTF